MTRSFFLSLLSMVFFISPAGATAINGKDAAIKLEDVDTDGNGIASPEETKAYLKHIERTYQKELEMQRQEQARLKDLEAAKRKAVVYDVADYNRDGSVSPEELAAYKKKLLAPAPVVAAKAPIKKVVDDKNVTPYMQKKYGWREGEMQAFDKNGDGILQAGELQNSRQAKFDAADLNKDGILSSQETAASLDKFKNEKQKSFGEATTNQQANRLKNRYNNADANDDKKVSKEEYESYMSKHQENFDKNGDGVISKDEYRTDGERLPASYLKKEKN